MSPRERFLATVRGRPADRVPLSLLGFLFCTREEVAVLKDLRRREIAERVFDLTAAPVYCPVPVNRWLVTPARFVRQVDRSEKDGRIVITTEIDGPRGKLTAVQVQDPATQTTWTVKYPVLSLEDVEKIRSVPWEVDQAFRPPDPADVPPTFGHKCYRWAGVSSPFVCVAGTMPREMFLELCLTEPDLIEELTTECLRRELDLLEVALSGGAVEYVWIGGCEWLTPPMASPALYERFVQPFEAKIIERARRAGAIVHVHCHGKVRSSLEAVIRRGADYFEPVEPPPAGDITFAEAKDMAAGRITLGGNVEAQVLEFGSTEEVEAATRAAFEGGKERMVLATSAGPLSDVTPRMLANYHRMIDVWEECAGF